MFLPWLLQLPVLFLGCRTTSQLQAGSSAPYVPLSWLLPLLALFLGHGMSSQLQAGSSVLHVPPLAAAAPCAVPWLQHNIPTTGRQFCSLCSTLLLPLPVLFLGHGMSSQLQAGSSPYVPSLASSAPCAVPWL